MKLAKVCLLLAIVSCDEAPRRETDERPANASTALAILPDRSVVVSKQGETMGESDLWIHPQVGAPRALAPAIGSDEIPTAMPDGRIAFVSTRTTVASLWILDPKSGELRQLTNEGLAAGRNMKGFVPPPMKRMTVEGRELRYEAAPGEWWAVDIETGAARKVEVER